MVDFYREKNVSFKLVNLEVYEHFVIWKDYELRKEEIKDKDGNIMKFPIFDGVLTGIDTIVRPVQDLKSMPKKQFQALYPKLTQNTTYKRNILVNMVEYQYDFKKTSNKKMVELIELCKSLGQDPLNMVFDQKFNPNAPKTDMYSVSMKPDSTIKADGATHVPSLPVFIILPREQEIIDAIKSVHGLNALEPAFITIMTSNGVTNDRAKELYQHYNR